MQASTCEDLRPVDCFGGEEARERILPLITKTPATRGIYYKVLEEVNDPKASLEKVARLVETDPVLTGRILQVVNSAALGLRQRVVNAHDAVMMLGGNQVKDIILIVEVFSMGATVRMAGFSPEKLWKHSLSVGGTAVKIMRTFSSSKTEIDAAFTSGILHDIGKLLLAMNIPEAYQKVLEDCEFGNSDSLLKAEGRLLGTTHAEVGAVVLESWKLPASIYRAVGYHHSPEKVGEEGLEVLDAVAIANTLVHEKAIESAGLDRTSAMSERVREVWAAEELAKWI